MQFIFIAVVLVLFLKKHLLISLAALGLHCGTQTSLKLRHIDSVVAACKLSCLAACGKRIEGDVLGRDAVKGVGVGMGKESGVGRWSR